MRYEVILRYFRFLGYSLVYNTDDGVPVNEGIEGFGSSKKAGAVFRKRIAKAARVVER